jgi:DNA-binding response OmpR family regulator
MATVLLVEDEEEIVGLMRDFLEADGFGVLSAPDGGAAIRAMDGSDVDCVLLDVMLPAESGFDVCRRIRARSDVPVLFLSARDGDSDKLRGLGLGADDYIVKSATPAEVVARVHAVLRRARGGVNGRHPAPLRFGRLEIDLTAREVRVDGRVVRLTTREFDLLRLFVEHPRQVLGRDQLFERLWGPYGDRSAISVYIRKLRAKLEPDPGTPQLIVTVWGTGYRFDPPA